MTNAQLGAAVAAAWRTTPPTSKTHAIEIARTVLAEYPKQQAEFTKYLDTKAGDLILREFIRE